MPKRSEIGLPVINLTVVVINSFLNPEGHQHPISGSKVTDILLAGWLLPIGGVASGRVNLIKWVPYCTFNIYIYTLFDF